MWEPEKTSRLVRPLSALLRLFFKLLYHQFAWAYDLVAAVVSLGLWDEWVLSALSRLKGPRVLEIGHGPGHLQVALHKKGLFTAGLDESGYMSRRAFWLMKKYRFDPVLVNGYAQKMPFQNSSFHQVVATFPSEFIFTSQTILEIYRVLAPGGELIVLPLAWITDRRPLYRLAARLFKSTGQAPEWEDHYADPFKAGGFQVQIEQVPMRSSTVLMIRARKSMSE